MKSHWRTLARLLLAQLFIGPFGLGVEVIFTAIAEARRDCECTLMGYSSVFYLGFYWMTPVVLLVMAGIQKKLDRTLHWSLRALGYAIMIMTIETAGNLLMKRLLGYFPSEVSYQTKRWALLGLTRLDFFPCWAIMGLILEKIWKMLMKGIDAMIPAISAIDSKPEPSALLTLAPARVKAERR